MISDISDELLSSKPRAADAGGGEGAGHDFTAAGGRADERLERLSMLESLVGAMSVELARGLLAGYPFRITGTIAFYILSRVELRNLSTVFVGKSAGMGEGGIWQRLQGLR